MLFEIQEATKNLSSYSLVEYLVNDHFKNKTIVSASLRARSIVFLQMLSDINPATPIIFCHAGTIYPDLNTGLIGVDHNDKTNRLLSEWVQLFEQTPPLKTGELLDQWSFREVFMKNKKMFHILPTYFMYRGDIIKQYPWRAVLSHDRSPEDGLTYKSNVTKKIIYNYVYSLK